MKSVEKIFLNENFIENLFDFLLEFDYLIFFYIFLGKFYKKSLCFLNKTWKYCIR